VRGIYLRWVFGIAAVAGLVAGTSGAAVAPPDVVCRPVPQGAVHNKGKPKQVITKKPLRVKITLPPAAQAQVRDALEGAHPRAVKLRLGGVSPVGAGEGVRGLSVYVNLPSSPSKADLKEGGSYWVGAVAFRPAANAGRPQSFNLDLSEALAAQRRSKTWQPDEPLTVTLVAIPEDDLAGLPKDLSIPVQTIEVSAIPSGKRE
jgi:hypothetical protein